jgi:superoxide reductase
MIYDSGAPLTCCGEEMKELIPNTSDGAVEKHVPVVKTEGNKVTVTIGSTIHPMTEAHYIMWVYLKTEQGGQRKCFKPGEKPEAVFLLTDDDKPLEAFEYCNLHGLWKADIK